MVNSEMALFKEGIITKNARELEQHLGSAVQHATAWAIEIQTSLATISHNTRGLLWWTSITAAMIISLFLIYALNSLRRVMVEINQHQALFRHMWEQDRAREEELREQEEARREALRNAIAAAAAARRGGGNGRQNGGGVGGGDAAGIPDETAARFQQMDDDIERLAAEAPEDPEERRRYMLEKEAEIRARYADLLLPEDQQDWQVDSDEEGA